MTSRPQRSLHIMIPFDLLWPQNGVGHVGNDRGDTGGMGGLVLRDLPSLEGCGPRARRWRLRNHPSPYTMLRTPS